MTLAKTMKREKKSDGPDRQADRQTDIDTGRQTEREIVIPLRLDSFQIVSFITLYINLLKMIY